MPFNDTSNKDGIIQTIEFWTGLGDAGISGNSTLLKIITGRVNEAFDRLMPLLLSYNDKSRWDDINHTDLPIATVSMVSGQADYKVTEDDNALDILNINGISVYESSTSTEYTDLKRMLLDDDEAMNAMSPNPSNTGVPTHFLEKGNVFFLYPEPNYAATNGIKIFFEREQSYFTSSDTTKEPGIPRPFHGLLPLYVSHDWLLVNRPDNSNLITRVEVQITKRERALETLIALRFPNREDIVPSSINYD